MKDITIKSDGDQVDATEYNPLTQELANAVTDTGQSLSAPDNFQISKSMSNYAAAGDFYNDTGTANNYALSPFGSRQLPTILFDGLIARFKVSNSNTGASVATIGSIAVNKPIKKNNGAIDVSAGDLNIGEYILLIYEAAGDFFELIKLSSTQAGGFTTGDGKISLKDSDPGFLLMNDDTFGSTLSGADYASDAYEDLYLFMWAKISDTDAPVTGGRTTAQDDWDDNKPMQLMTTTGMAIVFAGTTYALGSTFGAAAVGLTAGQNAIHSHPATVSTSTSTTTSINAHAGTSHTPVPGPTVVLSDLVAGTAAHIYSTNNNNTQLRADAATSTSVSTSTPTISTSGSGTPHENRQPSVAWNVLIKY